MLAVLKSTRCLYQPSFMSNFKYQRRCSTTTHRSTIFALSSGLSKSAIAVIRVSGPKSLDVIHRMTRRKKDSVIPRKALLCRIVDPKNEEMLDNGLVLWFPQPHSFTGENSVELHVHGGVAVVSSVINALHKLPGFRLAEAGEFTKRAYLAGKLDATEVEGLADLLRAETETQRRQAIRQATGELAGLYNLWRTRVLTCMAHLEAFIDFGEDQDIGEEVLGTLRNSVQSLKAEVDSHLNDNRRGERLRSGVKVAIIGEPNAGKSSLINILGRRNVAIVSPHAGTTRDVLEISLDIGGFPVVLCDTAGLRHSVDPVENEGLRRAREAAATADLVIIVMDASRGPESLWQQPVKDLIRHECERLNLSFNAENNYLVLLNKLDLVSPNVNRPPELSAISCKTEKGIPADHQFQATPSRSVGLGTFGEVSRHRGASRRPGPGRRVPSPIGQSTGLHHGPWQNRHGRNARRPIPILLYRKVAALANKIVKRGTGRKLLSIP
ncbi:tRNA modification GTPase MnmE-like isoform X3 [Daphnia pulex]|uniref:tRNA modification GTPase MnmE-like isoform X3 n=1 Tax=Daphnia pulex TaxID=6669 RepID=UPI001EE13108|nr:tRNA modification GTPase MnmE-like isoform X3 [Daphnia pulex]